MKTFLLSLLFQNTYDAKSPAKDIVHSSMFSNCFALIEVSQIKELNFMEPLHHLFLSVTQEHIFISPPDTITLVARSHTHTLIIGQCYLILILFIFGFS